MTGTTLRRYTNVPANQAGLPADCCSGTRGITSLIRQTSSATCSWLIRNVSASIVRPQSGFELRDFFVERLHRFTQVRRRLVEFVERGHGLFRAVGNGQHRFVDLLGADRLIVHSFVDRPKTITY